VELIPAIDIRSGRCVRLVQGDYARETVYDDDPVAVAQRWVEGGATRLHVVDLDGAREGGPRNRELIERIAASAPVPVQVGGGIRSADDARRYRDAGLARVILGTSAVEDRLLVRELAAALGEALVVGIDARDGIVRTRGWLESAGISALDLARELRGLGVGRFVYTDIGVDGMLQGPNLPALRQFIAAAGCPVIASGGVTRLSDLPEIAATGAEAVIVGKALYSGDVQLAEALALLRAPSGGGAPAHAQHHAGPA
jgi:phosphoribosylformimino-5-aminoimidazole carboxamide ribotide isomerase